MTLKQAHASLNTECIFQARAFFVVGSLSREFASLWNKVPLNISFRDKRYSCVSIILGRPRRVTPFAFHKLRASCAYSVNVSVRKTMSEKIETKKINVHACGRSSRFFFCFLIERDISEEETTSSFFMLISPCEALYKRIS